MTRPPLTDDDGEVLEFQTGDFKAARRIADLDPDMADIVTAMRNNGGRPRVAS